LSENVITSAKQENRDKREVLIYANYGRESLPYYAIDTKKKDTYIWKITKCLEVTQREIRSVIKDLCLSGLIAPRLF